MSKKNDPKAKRDVEVVSATAPKKRTAREIQRRMEHTAPGQSVPFKPGEKDYEERPPRPRGFKR